MKINPIHNPKVNPYQRNAEKVNQVKQDKKPLDRVEISSQAKNLQEVSHVTKEREAKVEALKQQVEDGTYKVDSKELAKNLINYFKK